MQYPYVKLGDVCKIVAGQSPESQFYTNDSSFTEFHQGSKKFGKREIYNSGIYTKHETKIAEPGSLLISVRAPVGDLNFTPRRICIGRGLAAITPSTKVDKNFLYYFLISATKNINDKAGAGTCFNSISRPQLSSFNIPLPPLYVQQETVSCLEKNLACVGKMADAFKRMAELADEEFESILAETFEHVEGKHIRFEDICKTVSTRGHQILQSEINKAGKYPVISQSENLIEGYSDFDNPIMEVPLVLFGDHTCCVKKIEKPFVVGADGTKLLYSEIHTIDFLYYFLVWCSPKLIDGKYRRHFSDLSKIEIPLLDISTQQRIVSKLECARNKSFKIKSESNHGLSLCSELRKSILQEAFA